MKYNLNRRGIVWHPHLPDLFSAAPSPALIPWGAFGALAAFASVYSSIGAVCEGNTETISARQVSVGLISGGGGKTHRNQPDDGAEP